MSRFITDLTIRIRRQALRQWRLASHTSVSVPRTWKFLKISKISKFNHLRDLVTFPHLLILLWVICLLWGERWVFTTSLQDCKWENWERWPKEATPHHLIFIADPQLIDPHSYPERPWILQWLTMLYTDKYIKRSYISLQKKLHPDTIFFLGDLFDGGREWRSIHDNSIREPLWLSEKRPKKEREYAKMWGKFYGEDYWLREYDRFGQIFYQIKNIGGSSPGPWQRGKKIITSLPGNHDLGFGENIKLSIRNRFEIYFGEGNRVDVIANHTFVSVDTVSMSASGSRHDVSKITRPIDEFLATVQDTKRKAVSRELNFIAGVEERTQYAHKVEDLESTSFSNSSSYDTDSSHAEFPTILLTHVPLYREPGTPCGPKREHWPPSKSGVKDSNLVTPDERNSISISGGYQYQNVLSPENSVKLISSIGNVKAVFSGDDHDYCEIVHSSDKNNAREITVKSISWAMGVRLPGFHMMSMWNPVDIQGIPISGPQTSTEAPITMQSNLCLLPDQIGIFIRYLFLLIFTLSSLTLHAILKASSDTANLPLRSYYTVHSNVRRDSRQETYNSSHSGTSSTYYNGHSNLASRILPAKATFSSSADKNGTSACESTQIFPYNHHTDDRISSESNSCIDLEDLRKLDSQNTYPETEIRKRSIKSQIMRKFWASFCHVLFVIVPFYLYLNWAY